MVLFIARRLAWAAVLLLTISLFAFVIFFVLPAAPTRQGAIGTQEVSIRDAFDFEGPIYVEYLQFTRGLFLEGSLGRSLSNRQEVSEIMLRAAPVTLSLVVGGVLLMLLAAIPAGVLSALRPRSLLDRATMVFVVIGLSAHPVWIGLVLAYFFGFKWQVFPLGGYCDLVNPAKACGGPVQWAYHLLLPWATFAFLLAALYARMTRAAVLDVVQEDYVRTARGKGAPESVVLRSHVLRNAMLPVVAMLGVSLADVGFMGVVFVERVYGLPGLGGMMLEGLQRRDPPLVLGVLVFASIAIVIFNLVADIAYTALDPRIRARESEGRLTLPRRRRRARDPAPPAAEAPATP